MIADHGLWGDRVIVIWNRGRAEWQIERRSEGGIPNTNNFHPNATRNIVSITCQCGFLERTKKNDTDLHSGIMLKNRITRTGQLISIEE